METPTNVTGGQERVARPRPFIAGTAYTHVMCATLVHHGRGLQLYTLDGRSARAGEVRYSARARARLVEIVEVVAAFQPVRLGVVRAG